MNYDDLTPDERFYYDHAGYGYRPGVETPEEGRVRSAARLDAARKLANLLGYSFEWQDDWDLGGVSHADYYCDEAYPNGEPETCESCTMLTLDGDVVASMGCVDDADDNYRRVVEADLCLNLYDTLVAEVNALLDSGDLIEYAVVAIVSEG